MNLTVPVSRQALQPTDCWYLPPDDKYQVSQDRFLSMWSFPVVWKRGKLSNRIFTLFLSTRPRDCRASLPGAISLPPGDDNWTKVEETRSFKSSLSGQLRLFCIFWSIVLPSLIFLWDRSFLKRRAWDMQCMYMQYICINSDMHVCHVSCDIFYALLLCG